MKFPGSTWRSVSGSGRNSPGRLGLGAKSPGPTRRLKGVTMITSSVNERDERKQTFRSSIVNFENDIITGACTSFREKHRGNLLTVCAVSGA